jgi:hypothetical protein
MLLIALRVRKGRIMHPNRIRELSIIKDFMEGDSLKIIINQFKSFQYQSIASFTPCLTVCEGE